MERLFSIRPLTSHALLLLFLSVVFAGPVHAQDRHPRDRTEQRSLAERVTDPHLLETERAIRAEWDQVRQERLVAMPASSGSVLTSDSLALVALYNATNGDEWTDNTGWLSAPVDQWYGVTVSGNRVVDLRVLENNMGGTLPPELAALSALRYLDFYTNDISGEIPQEWSALGQLELLRLSYNQLSGAPLALVSTLTSLRDARLSGNAFDDVLPEEIASLVQLRHLGLYDTGIKGPIPSSLGSLPNLERLDIAYNDLNGPIPSEFGRLTHLSSLRLQGNDLEGRIPPELGQLKQLRTLHLGNNRLTGSIPDELRHLTGLETLDLGMNSLSGDMPAWLHELANLRLLWLGRNPLSGTFPESVTTLPQLELLDLSSTGIEGAIPPSIWQIDNLVALNLSNTNLTGPLPPGVGRAARLIRLELDGLGLSGELPNELDQLSNLATLRVSENELRSLPDLSRLTELHSVFVDGNRLGFESIEPLYGYVSRYEYEPQDRVGYRDTLRVNRGEEVHVSVETGGEHSVYQWYRDLQRVEGATSNPYVIPSMTPDDVGEHVLYVSNTLVDDLTLVSEPIHVVLNTQPELTAYAAPSGILRVDSVGVTWAGHDPDGTIEHLEWELDGTLSESGTNTTGALAWTDLPPGDYTLRARLVDDTRGVTPWQENAFTVVENAVPTVATDQVTLDEDELVTIHVLANDTDANGDTLRIAAFSEPADGTLSLDVRDTPDDPTDDVFHYTPAADYFGTDAFTYEVEDGYGGTAEGAVDLTIVPVNDPPRLAQGDAAEATQDEPFSSDVLATDVEGDAYSVGVVALPTWLVYTDSGAGTSGTLSGVPGPTDVGMHHAVFELDDGTDAANDTLTIDVANVNDAPVAATDRLEVPEDSTYVLAVLANDSDADGDMLTITITRTPEQGEAHLEPEHPDGIAYVPAPNYNGPDTLAYQIEDPAGAHSAEALVYVAVTPVNDPPAITSTPPTAARQDSAYSYVITAEDIEVDSLRFTGASLPSWLSVAPTNSAAAVLSGTPGPADVGEHTITIGVSDGTATTRQIFTLAVANINDAPSAVAIAEPEDGAELVVEGERGQPFVVTWEESMDPDENDEVEYAWELARTDSFAVLLMRETTGTDTRFETTYGTMTDLLVDEVLTLDQSLIVFHRVVTSDGTIESPGPPSQLTLTRGQMVGVDDVELPAAFALHGNYPNPFSGTTQISLDVPAIADVVVTVFDLLGREVFRTAVASLAAGSDRTVVIDGGTTPSGLLLYRIDCRPRSGSMWSGYGSMTLLK